MEGIGSSRITLDCFGETQTLVSATGSRVVDLNGMPVGEFYTEGLTARLLDGSAHNGQHHHGSHHLLVPASAAHQAQYRPWESKGDGLDGQLHLVTTSAMSGRAMNGTGQFDLKYPTTVVSAGSWDGIQGTFTTGVPMSGTETLTLLDGGQTSIGHGNNMAIQAGSKLPSFQSQFQPFSPVGNGVHSQGQSPIIQTLSSPAPSGSPNNPNYPLVPAPIQARDIPQIQQQYLDERQIHLFPPTQLSYGTGAPNTVFVAAPATAFTTIVVPNPAQPTADSTVKCETIQHGIGQQPVQVGGQTQLTELGAPFKQQQPQAQQQTTGRKPGRKRTKASLEVTDLDGSGVESVSQVPAVSSTAQSQHMHQSDNEKSVKKKRKRCGECVGCQRKDNCGNCAPCKNSKSHQICKMRRCEKLTEKRVRPHHRNKMNRADRDATAAARNAANNSSNTNGSSTANNGSGTTPLSQSGGSSQPTPPMMDMYNSSMSGERNGVSPGRQNSQQNRDRFNNSGWQRGSQQNENSGAQNQNPNQFSNIQNVDYNGGYSPTVPAQPSPGGQGQFQQPYSRQLETIDYGNQQQQTFENGNGMFQRPIEQRPNSNGQNYTPLASPQQQQQQQHPIATSGSSYLSPASNAVFTSQISPVYHQQIDKKFQHYEAGHPNATPGHPTNSNPQRSSPSSDGCPGQYSIGDSCFLSPKKSAEKIPIANQKPPDTGVSSLENVTSTSAAHRVVEVDKSSNSRSSTPHGSSNEVTSSTSASPDAQRSSNFHVVSLLTKPGHFSGAKAHEHGNQTMTLPAPGNFSSASMIPPSCGSANGEEG